MQQEAPQELVSRHGHHLVPLLVFVVLVGETDLPVLESFQTVVGPATVRTTSALSRRFPAAIISRRNGITGLSPGISEERK